MYNDNAQRGTFHSNPTKLLATEMAHQEGFFAEIIELNISGTVLSVSLLDAANPEQEYLIPMGQMKFLA